MAIQLKWVARHVDDAFNLAGVCETEEDMQDYAKMLRRAEIHREIEKKKKEREAKGNVKK